MKNLFSIVRSPLITEKASLLREKDNQYVFKVHLEADKLAIKKAVESVYKVNVLSVHTLIQRGKEKRRGRTRGLLPKWKKAIVSISEGQKIQIFEGV